MAKIINLQKVQELLNDKLILELMQIIEGFKNPDFKIESYEDEVFRQAAISFGKDLDRDVKSLIFQWATDEV